MPTIDSRVNPGDMDELRRRLREGAIQRAYRALYSFMLSLRSHFVSKYGSEAISGLYQGYLDMTYFAIVPPALKQQDLKVAIVFNYDAFRFEAWLAARNRKIQRQYWELFKEHYSDEYRVIAPAAGIDAIVQCNLAVDFDLSDSAGLTSRIEAGTVAFIDHIEGFLAEHQP